MNDSRNKNLKDAQKDSLKDTSSLVPAVPSWRDHSGSYTKVHKLVTALYMVTDIIDKEEPMKNKLRILGTEIISDMHSIQQKHSGHIESINVCNRISETVSFLNIASAMNFISEMNCAILKKEFLELKASIQEDLNMKPTWLADFFENSEFPPLLNEEGAGGGDSLITTSPFGHSSSSRRRENSKGHQSRTRIGVQKGSTLLKALSEVERVEEMSDRMPAPYEARGFRSGSDMNINSETRSGTSGFASRAQDFEVLKKQRRDSIIGIIKNNEGSATITDIKNNAQGLLASCSEKTLQRELMSMTKDGVLKKTGEKRWSRYLLK